ncbi:DUF262 domain-containing protein [Streptococcus hyovaginalis]|uniref:DUF262 domain-containing protein n=1 Tax=Streptococcus hyovaginalis TaxID=149015 RepID=UPI0014794B56|nr:DUF262 domain-containing protein [Streptococcus hyovaginalis]
MDKQVDLFEDVRKEEIQKQIDDKQDELDYDTRDYPIEYLVDLYNSDEEKVFAPNYQREELLWNIHYKSRFIESLILDYPIPLIFLADTDTGQMEVIDGLQRISTLSQFFRDEFELQTLKKLTKLNGCSYYDLPEGEKKRLKAKSLRIIVLKKFTSEEVRKELFDRLNTSSLRASTSEVRSGRENDNPLMKLIVSLKENELFKKTTGLSKNRINRKEDIELITRFFAYSHNLEKYNNRVMNFIDEYVELTGKNWTAEKEEIYNKEFINTMNFVHKNFKRGFQKEDRNQTPRVRFEALAVGINLALREKPDLVTTDQQVNRLLHSSQFEEWTTSDAANNKNKVFRRINGVKEYFLTDKLIGNE